MTKDNLSDLTKENPEDSQPTELVRYLMIKDNPRCKSTIS